jgi:hypothetical protein
MFVLISLISWPKGTTFWIELSWIMVLLVWSRNETPKHAMENISITETKKGTHVMSPSEDSAYLFVFLITRTLFTLSFLNTVKQWTSIVIWKYWQGYVRLLIGEDLNFGLILGSCIMTASAHYVLTVWEFLAKKSTLTLDCAPYSPDLAPCDFWLFPKLKTTLKGHRFSDIADIQGHATTILQSILEDEFQKCLEQWKHQLTNCIGVQGD